MEQIREGVLGDGLEGNFWEEGLSLCVHSNFEYLHGCSGHNIPWQLVPVQDYSNANRMLAATDFTPLLVNLYTYRFSRANDFPVHQHQHRSVASPLFIFFHLI